MVGALNVTLDLQDTLSVVTVCLLLLDVLSLLMKKMVLEDVKSVSQDTD